MSRTLSKSKRHERERMVGLCEDEDVVTMERCRDENNNNERSFCMQTKVKDCRPPSCLVFLASVVLSSESQCRHG